MRSRTTVTTAKTWRSELSRYTWTNTINVNKDFANGHSLNAVAGMEMFQGKWYTSNFTGYDLIFFDMMQSPAGIGDKSGSSLFPPSIGGGRTMSNLMSFFAQASYSIANKYNFSASLRHDTFVEIPPRTTPAPRMPGRSAPAGSSRRSRGSTTRSGSTS